MRSSRISVFASYSMLAIGGLIVAGCSSGELKARQEQRERIVQTSKLYCEFVNGDNHHDIDVAINLAMGAKCDAEKSFSLTNYRTPSEINGVLFCCGVRGPKAPEAKPEVRVSKPQAPAVAESAPQPVVPDVKPVAKPAAQVPPAAASGVAAPAPTGAVQSTSSQSAPQPTASPAIPKVEFVETPSTSGQ